jgi:two-component system, NarL family, sensor histidine kinase UhpB
VRVPGRPVGLESVPLFWRVFAINAAVLGLAATVLVASPATVSFPVALTEAIVLAVGLAAMLVLNFALLRRALAPLDRLRVLMRGTDPLRPGVRAPVDHATPELRAVTETFNEMVQRLETERRESAGRALAAQEGERLRIAQELHDEVGQKLTAALLRLDRAAGDQADGAIAEARESVRESLVDVRVIARRLRPEALDELGLVSALAALTNSLQRAGATRIIRQIETPLPALEADSELVVYRVAQEALTNVLRHANCGEAFLELRPIRGGVQLVVSDDGAGFDAKRVQEGAGIRGMRERALLINAELEIGARPSERGTQVVLNVPSPGVRQR